LVFNIDENHFIINHSINGDDDDDDNDYDDVVDAAERVRPMCRR